MTNVILRITAVSLALASLVMVSACKEEKMRANRAGFGVLTAVSDEGWQRLAEKRIYFGHQSVGNNILDGIRDIMKENSHIRLNIGEIKNPSEIAGPMLAHSRIGENGDRFSKIRGFASAVDNGLGRNTDISFFKLCYVDITAKTDVERLFSEYRAVTERLQKEYPTTQILHATVPLTVSKTTLKTRIKKLIGKTELWEYDDNVRRNEFNDRLRGEYGGQHVLFDLAAIESTFPDGSRCSFTKGGKTYYSLAPEYSVDGGHLNKEGRRVVAGELLVFLANMGRR